jgi:hypothetical protein
VAGIGHSSQAVVAAQTALAAEHPEDGRAGTVVVSAGW